MTAATAQDRRLMVLYGVTEAEHTRIFEAQGRACAICRTPPKKLKLGTDHHHRLGVTRGLLCWPCNKAIAYLADDPIRAQRAADYLTEPPSKRALGYLPVARTGRATRKWRTKREKQERLAWVEQQLVGKGYTLKRRRAA